MGLLGRDGQALPLQLQGEAAAQGTERVLVLSDATQSFVFTGITQDVVPSLLRGFSAPVLLDDGLGDADLLVLLAHDSDAFNRWEASQRLAVKRLADAVAGDGQVVLDDAYLAALRGLLGDAGLDPSFKALALQVPAESYLAELITPVDPQRIHAACESWQAQVAAQLHADWVAAFDAHQVREGYRPDAAQSGRRALANLALAMLVRHAVASGDSVWPGRAFQRFKDATNMTDRLGALEALVNAHAELAQPALERFLALFPGEALVVDKWFQVQDRKSTRLNSSHSQQSRMPSSA